MKQPNNNLPRKFSDLFDLYIRFARISNFGLTAMMPLLGAGSTAVQPPPAQIFGLLMVALAFHHYGYILNDYIDLPVDRTQLRRANSPLVRGLIQPHHALWFALFQIPLAFFFTYLLHGSWAAHLALGVAFATGAMYDLWGKTTIFPPLTDTVQGVAWASMIFYGVAIAGASPTHLTWLLATFVVVFIVLVNGVHGSLRDIVTDWESNMRTTVIVLGARPDPKLGVYLSKTLLVYIAILQTLVTGLVFWPLLTNKLGYTSATRGLTFAIVLFLQLLSIGAEIAMLRTTDTKRLFGPVMLYIIFCLASLIALFAGRISFLLLCVLVITYFGPLLLDERYAKPIWYAIRKPFARKR